MAIVANRADAGGGTVDKSFCTYNRVVADNPNGTTTPEYAGEIVYDDTNDVLWMAKHPTANDKWTLHTPVLV